MSKEQEYEPHCKINLVGATVQRRLNDLEKKALKKRSTNM